MRSSEFRQQGSHDTPSGYQGPIEMAELKGHEDKRKRRKSLLGKVVAKMAVKMNAAAEKALGLDKLNKQIQEDAMRIQQELDATKVTFDNPFIASKMSDPDYWWLKDDVDIIDLDAEPVGSKPINQVDYGYGPSYNNPGSFSEPPEQQTIMRVVAPEKTLVELQNEAEATYDIEVELAEDDEELTPDEIIERMEVDHSVKTAPRFAEQLQDTTRTNEVIYLSGESMSLTTDTSDEVYSESRKTLTEHEMLAQLDEFLRLAISHSEGKTHRDGHREVAESLRENLTFIGKKEYAEATKGIADYWKALLERNSDQQILVLAGEIAKRYGSITKKIKSDEYMLENILANFTDEEIEKYKGRLITDMADITATDTKDLRIIFLDDWTISGSQLRKVTSGVMNEYPQFASSVEIQLIAANEYRIERGLNEFTSYGSLNVSKELAIPVRAYYRAHDAKDAENSSRITGFHSSVDFDFENDIASIVSMVKDSHDESAPEGLTVMPPMTNIVRPYRMNGHRLTQKDRFRTYARNPEVEKVRQLEREEVAAW